MKNLDSLRAIDGKIFALLSPYELTLFKSVRREGRKHNIRATVIYDGTQGIPFAGLSIEQKDEALRRTNSKVRVFFDGSHIEYIEGILSKFSSKYPYLESALTELQTSKNISLVAEQVSKAIDNADGKDIPELLGLEVFLSELQ